jgi:hypothetical protein
VTPARCHSRITSNRIVLYIDDLDRCPPDRVVQVLQAVHLLLAFPLFVVVVAVDSRWLSQSLHKHYEELLRSKNGSTQTEAFNAQATPQDYLEKIFQVPFWVRPLTSMGRAQIVNGLVQASLKRTAITVDDAHGPDLKSDTRGPSFTPPTGTEPGTAQSEVPPQPDLTPPSAPSQTFRVDAPTDPNPPALEVLDYELAFMDDLRDLLGQTPRAVKRFVNIYRLIKTMALSRTASFTKQDQVAEYRKVLFLLAVLTGLPNVSAAFFRNLHITMNANPGTHLSVIIARLHKPVSTDLPLNQNGTSEVIDAATNELQRLEGWLKNHADWQVLPTTAFQAWLPEVTRFSFQREVV